MAITPASLEKLKAGAISKVIESLGSKLKRVGREYVTQCIWHNDTNPSLTINDDKGFCFCHVCREGGDAVKYVQKRKGLSFPDAAELTANILGIQLEHDGISKEEQEKRRKARLTALAKLQRDQDQWTKNLHDPKAGRIRQILKDRGLKKEAAEEFGLGFAPDGFFAGRITIPIYNHSNELVGWTGRATKDQPGKYKNSADGDLFHKKTLVFNEPRAKEAARLTGSLIFVEGHLDVVSLWQHGVTNVVAMQGTGAPEPFVLERLARSADNFILCFDGDEGGRKAVQQFISAAGPMAQAGKLQINVAQMPAGKDPDEVCRESGVDGFYALVADADPWLDWVIEYWAADLDKNDTKMVTEVEQELRKVIDRLSSAAVRAHYVDKAARVLSQTTKEAQAVVKSWGTFEDVKVERAWVVRSEEKCRIATERRLLRIFVHRPHLRDELRPLLAAVSHPPLRWLCDRLGELEEHCATDLTPYSVMAVVAASEPHFLQQLRTVVQPNVTIDDAAEVIQHIKRVVVVE